MKKGFTLIELLVVIAVIGLLASIVLVTVNDTRVKARDVKRLNDLKQIQLALEMYYDDNNEEYPNLLAYVASYQDINWSTGFQPALAPYLSPLPKEQIHSHYLYSATNSGQKYGLACGMEHSSNFDLADNDNGFYSGDGTYYEVGPSPSICAAAGKDWWGSTTINCP